ncbi:uncharacterized protein MELLADRAFT_77108 [Melampsora larici-populina 98AG31]|uniref:Phytase n=1 Tax=Melampsora larici-populina (strain 98AG31 / pathotype 3-4-7) TaxID=747676 RepID=F4RDC5_MELLP|nr:uncharacterized protein MELLADRAFT_77108 [Melampsora larici-populina 98AG31]EGG09376.1 hypothetical protein MELLADRAFT_77108 [Melampsora larici-populina 98AG31]
MDFPRDVEKDSLLDLYGLRTPPLSIDETNEIQTEALLRPRLSNRTRTVPSQTYRTLRDVTIGFMLASAVWVTPWMVARTDWSCARRLLHHLFDHSNNPFPSGDHIGYAGPARAGSEPFAAVTAKVPPQLESYFPLVPPQSNKSNDFDPIRSWGYLSPFQSLPHDTFGLESATAKVPPTCELEQVHMLHRHGARYPTSSKEPAGFANRLKAAKGYKATGQLEFLNNWKYGLGIEILTPFGRNQLFNLGVGFRQKYGHLLDRMTDSTKKLVFRTTSQNRMLHSALNFAAGFWGIPFESQYHQSILIEAKDFNNTLAPYFTCDNGKEASGTYVSEILANWSAIYLADTLPRLQADLDGYTLTFKDLVSMQQLCAYETVSFGWSSFCELFTPEEFKGFAYYSDLAFWYAYSFGSPAAAALGKGWVQELLSRLTKTNIAEFDSTVNSTLHLNPVTFPLDQPIYVDATHDTVISCIIVALNLTTLASEGPLPTTYIPEKQSFISAHISPFAANLQTQVVNCDGEKQIRFLLNDAPVPLTGVKGCEINSQGFCSLQTVVDSLTERLNEIDYNHDCNTEHGYKPPVGGGGIVDGRPPRRSIV